MAFTAGSPELADAQHLAQKLANLYSSFGTTFGVAGNGIAGPAHAAARALGFRVTGFTTGAGFPAFGTMAEDGLTHGTDGTTSTGTTLGANTGLTVGIYLHKFVRSDRPNAGTTFESYRKGTEVNAGFTAAVYFGGGTGAVS